jgi:deoxyribose-phosphate aldolase
VSAAASEKLAREIADAAGRRMAAALAGEQRRPAAPGRAAMPPGAIVRPSDLAPLIDHTLLKPDATDAEVECSCREALQHGFAGVCVRGALVATAARLLEGTPVLPIAVVDFPLGEGKPMARVEEARRAVDSGARELDVVVALPALLRRDHAAVVLDLEAVVLAAGGAAVKVILEMARLDRYAKVAGCALAKAAGAAWVKTSTGFGPGGATGEDVALMRTVVGPDLGVKASGGIRTPADALRMVRAGASRIGTSGGVAIVTGSF